MYLANKQKKRPWMPWLMGALLLVFLVTFSSLLGPILSPFIIAAVLAYILNPLVVKLQKRRMKRGLAALVVMSGAFLVLIALLLVIVPMLIEQVNSVIARIPALVDFVQQKLLPWVNERVGKNITVNTETVGAWLRANVSTIQAHLQRLMPMLMQQGTSLAVWIGNLVILPLLLYYFLRDWNRWAEGLRTMVPRRYLDTYNRISGSLDRVLGEFLRGQLLVMIVMGLIYGIGLMLVGLDSGFAIGMVAGILVFIPYLGAFTGLLLATLAAVLQFDGWTGLLLVWGVFGIGQLLESFFITPQIVGERIGLSPFWVIFALLAFGQLMGFVGMLVGLPLAAVAQVLLQEGKTAYLNSRFYRRDE